jgi:membrane protein
LGGVGTLIVALLHFAPYIIFWGLLTYLYIFIPNGKIHFKSALLGGIVAGTVYQLVQWLYIHFQIGVSGAGAVYGSFAALPMFLIWIQLSWRIVLYGAELAFAHQNEQTFEFEPECLNANYQFKKLLALRITQLCVSRFADGLLPLSSEAIALALGIPIRLTRELLEHLVHANLLTAIQGASEKERVYQPARDVGAMTIQFVVSQMEQAGTSNVPVIRTSELETLRKSLDAFERSVQGLPANILLKDLAACSSKV